VTPVFEFAQREHRRALITDGAPQQAERQSELRPPAALRTTDVLLSWSGGKDSAMALHMLRQDPSYKVECLLTTITEDYDRISIHGVRRALLHRQAEALDVDLFEVSIPAKCTHETYRSGMVAALTSQRLSGIDTHSFADLFLEDVRAYREANLAELGKRAIFPVWGHDTENLARDFISLGFHAVVVCVDSRILDQRFAGREFDRALLEDLPNHVDPCGENGEFHTFVYDGPGFRFPVRFERGETVVRNGFAFRDLVEA
jgi:uncharacterized protein (TIGR00290 family)